DATLNDQDTGRSVGDGSVSVFRCAHLTDNGDRTDRAHRHDRAATDSCVRTAADSWTGLPVGAGVLELRSVRLLLGARDLVGAARGRAAVDSRLLGLVGGILRVESGLLGAAGRLLRRRELRLRLSGSRLLGR